MIGFFDFLVFGLLLGGKDGVDFGIGIKEDGFHLGAEFFAHSFHLAAGISEDIVQLGLLIRAEVEAAGEGAFD